MLDPGWAIGSHLVVSLEVEQGSAPGAPPGIDRDPRIAEPPPPGTVRIQCIQYGPDRIETLEVEDLEGFLGGERPAWCAVRWINVDGLHPYVINRFREAYSFHTLAAEDALHAPQRSKLDAYDDHLFLVAHMPRGAEGGFEDEQVSFVRFGDTLLTFQERAGEVWDPVRKRLERKASRLRNGTTDYLVYALLDSIVHHVFPLLEGFGDRLEDLEDEVVERARQSTLQEVYRIKRELVGLRRILWQMREMVDAYRDSEVLSENAEIQAYLRDVYDHVLRAIDLVETYRELASSLTDLYMSAISNRMNEVMRILTVTASLFIPITFLAGVYGMNFEYIPELQWRGAYVVFWITCLTVTVSLIVFFRRKGWLGGD